MGGWIAHRRGALVLSLILAATPLLPGWTKEGIAFADQKAEAPAEYHTPLAGEPLHAVFMGKALDIPALDRGRVSALMLGGVFYTPKQGDTSATPIGALYLRRVWEESRTRNVISIFVNDLEYDRSFGNLELVTRFENHTLPGGQREVVNNQEIKSSDAVWGRVIASLGPGLRYKVAPFQVDNDLRLQLLCRPDYPGTMFNRVLVSNYALAALEYRRELAPFFYLRLRETLIWANRAAVTDTNQFLFKSSTGAATTIGLDTGFFWNSALYLGYSWDSSFIRNGKSGSGLILAWSKLF